MRRVPIDRSHRIALGLLLGLFCVAGTGCSTLKKTNTAQLWIDAHQREDPTLYAKALVLTAPAMLADTLGAVGSLGEMADEAGALDALADYNKQAEQQREREAARQRAYQSAYAEILAEQAGQSRETTQRKRREREAAQEKRESDRRQAAKENQAARRAELQRDRERRAAGKSRRDRERVARDRRQEEETERVINQRLAELGEDPIETKKSHRCTVLDDFISVVETKWGDRCGSDDSFTVVVRNDGSESIEVELCLEQKNGNWDCGSSTTQPSKRLGNFTCHATGNYEFRGRAREDWGRGCTPSDPNTRRPIPLSMNRIRGS